MDDHCYMSLAINLARAGRGQTSPNPAVGAVVVQKGEIVGLGAHLKAGDAHAEVHALKMAGERARAAELYVTLEPCSHYGRTPPCADLIIEREIKKVFVSTLDPNPRVAGEGVKKLRRAGIAVEVGLLAEEAKKLNEAYFHYMTTGLPFVTLKQAASLDGKTATETGESKWITGEEARRDSHRLRALHDAILVGVGTVICDDPSLTVRYSIGGRPPVRIILDHDLKIPANAKVLRDEMAPTWIVTTQKAAEEKVRKLKRPHIEVIQLTNERIEIKPLLKTLGKRGITSLYVEGGAKVNGSFLQSGYFQKVVTYFAPLLIGGERAPTTFSGPGFLTLAESKKMKITKIERLGSDVKIVAVPVEKGEQNVYRNC